MSEKILLSWSCGKESAMTYHHLQGEKAHDVVALLTTVTHDYDRVSMHGVRRVLLQKQAHILGLPIKEVSIPKEADNTIYEEQMGEMLSQCRKENILTVGFGDIFLEDLKKYREEKLSQVGMRALFPLWKKDTGTLIRDFIDQGFKAVVTCLDSKVLDASFAGRVIDDDFLSGLPPHVDPCGENGEFHTFVFDGPIFSEGIPIIIGEKVQRNGFLFCDVLPG